MRDRLLAQIIQNLVQNRFCHSISLGSNTSSARWRTRRGSFFCVCIFAPTNNLTKRQAPKVNAFLGPSIVVHLGPKSMILNGLLEPQACRIYLWAPVCPYSECW